jgi:hypothetical protein
LSAWLLEGADMHDYDRDNDGRFLEDGFVKVRYPWGG